MAVNLIEGEQKSETYPALSPFRKVLLLELDFLADAPRVRQWCDRFRERPAAKETILA